MLQGSVLFDVLSSALKKKKKRKGKGGNGQGAFSQGRHTQLLLQLKAV
jgi:hypothetical protein